MVRGRGVHKQLDQPVKKNLKKLYKFCMVTFGKTFPRHFPHAFLKSIFFKTMNYTRVIKLCISYCDEDS